MDRNLFFLLLWVFSFSTNVWAAPLSKIHSNAIELNQKTSGKILSITIASDQILKITCFYQGYQNPDIIWSLGSTVLSTYTHVDKYASASSLTVSGNDINEQGQKFTCETSGLKENLNVTVEVILEVPDHIEFFDIEVSPNTAGHNIPIFVSGTKTIQINCFIQDYSPPSPVWFNDKGSRLLSSDYTGKTFSVSKLVLQPSEIKSIIDFKCGRENLPENFVSVSIIIEGDATKAGFPGHFPSESGSSTPKDVEPKVGNDDFDSWKNLTTALIAVLLFTLFVLSILVICTGKYILTDKSGAFPKHFFPELKIFTDSCSTGSSYFQSNIVQTNIKNSALDSSEYCEPPKTEENLSANDQHVARETYQQVFEDSSAQIGLIVSVQE